MIHTPLCDLLGIVHPILNAPMSGTATAALATAVSQAGGFGMIGGTSRGGPDWLRAQIRAVREHTARPFVVGFISSFPGLDDLVQVRLTSGSRRSITHLPIRHRTSQLPMPPVSRSSRKSRRSPRRRERRTRVWM